MITEHDGRIDKLMGGWPLDECTSVAIAVACGMARQQEVVNHELHGHAGSQLCFVSLLLTRERDRRGQEYFILDALTFERPLTDPNSNFRVTNSPDRSWPTVDINQLFRIAREGL